MPVCPVCNEQPSVDPGRRSKLKPSPHATIAALVVGLSLVGGCGCRDDKRGGEGTYGTGVGTQENKDSDAVVASGFLGVDRARESRVPGRRVRRGAPLRLA